MLYLPEENVLVFFGILLSLHSRIDKNRNYQCSTIQRVLVVLFPVPLRVRGSLLTKSDIGASPVLSPDCHLTVQRLGVTASGRRSVTRPEVTGRRAVGGDGSEVGRRSVGGDRSEVGRR